MGTERERQDKMDHLAREILIWSRNTLLVNLRFLDAALGQFTYVPIPYPAILTDGAHIFYHPRPILREYQQAKEISVRNYLHMVMHCVFRHMYVNPMIERAYWNLACDIAVENMITELGVKAAAAPREKAQQAYMKTLKASVKQITAEKVYLYLRETKMDARELQDMQSAFAADVHDIWYMSGEEKEKQYGISSVKETSRDDRQENDNQSGAEREGAIVGEDVLGKQGGQNGEGSSGDGNGARESRKSGNKESMESVWKRIAERMQVDLETFNRRQHGHGIGAMTQNLAAVNREKYDYTAFLKKFAVMGEAMRINDDEFDYIFYTYGLKRYGNMPLIEPLEYKEVKRIREFVIAIDTSGSVQGELVQKFVQKTYNILKSTENFFTKINLHIIQCDADIQEDIKITSQEEFDAYLKNMQLKGFGGTDFRPVFQYVDELQKKKEFINLKGLIYFTDGYGTFPDRKPAYETAFVFIEDDYGQPEVPPWAIRLVLQRDEVEEMRV